jgi:uncharacterized protein YjbI with pentapeptide repeats
MKKANALLFSLILITTSLAGCLDDSEEPVDDSIPLRDCESDVGPNMNLSGFNLTGCNLSNLDLSNSNLSNANLTGADLNGTNLTNSNLTESILTGTNMLNTNLNLADLSYAMMDEVQSCSHQLPENWHCETIHEYRFWADEIYHFEEDFKQESYDRIMDVDYDEREDEFYRIIEEHYEEMPEWANSSTEYNGIDENGRFMGALQHIYLGPKCIVGESVKIYLQHLDFSEMNLSQCQFSGVNFKGSNFSNTNFDLSEFYDSDFIDSKLSNIAPFQTLSFIDSVFENVEFTNIEMTLASLSFSHSQIINSNLSNITVGDFSMYLTNVYSTDLSFIHAEYGFFQRVTLSVVNLIGMEISQLKSYQPLYHCSTILLDNGSECFGNTILGPGISSYRVNLSGYDLSNLNLTGAGLTYVVCPELLPPDWQCISPPDNSTYADPNGYDGVFIGPTAVLFGASFNGFNLSGIDLSVFELGNNAGMGLIECPVALPDEYYCMNNNIVGPSLNLYGANLSGLNMSMLNLTWTNANHLPYCPSSLPSDYVCITENPTNDTDSPDISYIILGPGISLRGSAHQSYYNFTDMDLSGINLSNADLQFTDFTNTDFTDANLEGTNWWYCICPDGTNSEDNDETCENNL